MHTTELYIPQTSNLEIKGFVNNRYASYFNFYLYTDNEDSCVQRFIINVTTSFFVLCIDNERQLCFTIYDKLQNFHFPNSTFRFLAS